MIGNTYGSTSQSYGGSFPAWKEVKGKETSGGTLSSLPAVGTVIPAGTLVSLDSAGGTAVLVKTWKVAAAALSTATSIKVKLSNYMSLAPVVGDFIMIAPATAATTGQGAEISAVALDSTDTNGLTYDVTLDAAIGTALTTSTILVQATSAEATASVIAVPTGILENDINIENGTSVGTTASVYDGVIWEDRNAPVPACFKVVLPMIKFEKGV